MGKSRGPQLLLPKSVLFFWEPFFVGFKGRPRGRGTRPPEALSLRKTARIRGEASPGLPAFGLLCLSTVRITATLESTFSGVKRDICVRDGLKTKKRCCFGGAENVCVALGMDETFDAANLAPRSLRHGPCQRVMFRSPLQARCWQHVMSRVGKDPQFVSVCREARKPGSPEARKLVATHGGHANVNPGFITPGGVQFLLVVGFSPLLEGTPPQKSGTGLVILGQH